MVKVIFSGNSKLGSSIATVSTTPIEGCPNCEHCKEDCYMLKLLKIRPSVAQRYAENLDHAINDLSGYFDAIIDQISRKRKPPRFFRWHVGGDILSQAYLDGVIRVAGKFPNIKFLAFTKMYDLDYSGKPDNLSIVFSMWPTMDSIPDVSPKSWVQDGTEKRVPDDAIECTGNCESCGMCWNLAKIGRDVCLEIH